MNNKVKITAKKDRNEQGEVIKTYPVFTLNTDENGALKVGKDGKQYGSLRVESQTIDFSGPVAKVKSLSAFKSMLASDYEKAKDYLVEGCELSGKIIIKENTIGGKGYKVKRAGSAENAETCTVGGLPIYRATEFTSDLTAQDTLIKHDNVIKGSNAIEVDAAEALNGKKK